MYGCIAIIMDSSDAARDEICRGGRLGRGKVLLYFVLVGTIDTGSV